MKEINNKPKVVIIVGPTASGKTSLSIHLAKIFSGEVISADSRQIYKGLDLGTGKVTKEEMGGVPHYLLDVADTQNVYTVADYVRDGRSAINTILSHQHLPIIVGGTFLYIDALLGKISAPEVLPNAMLRAALKNECIETLFERLTEKDPHFANVIDKSNKRRLIRALEIIEALGTVPQTIIEEPYNTLTIGITVSKEQLRKNISNRLATRIAQGMIEEVQNLHKNGLSYARLSELGLEYKFISEFLQNNISHEEMIMQIETKSIQYAKRQMTWLKRNTEIQWFEIHEVEKTEEQVKGFLE